MEDILDELEPYFDEIGFKPEEEEIKIRQLYKIFQNDFVASPIIVGGTSVSIKPYNSEHVGQPEYFKEFLHDFVHTITRLGNTEIGKRRIFEPQRANRIHWIKPILENSNDSRIEFYQFTESDGKVRDYFWYEEKNFIVILEKILPDYWLITAHIVDDNRRHRKRLWDYLQSKKRE